ncbi:MAG TPA: hypothetical protein VJV03_03650 [Pyrinomonadaceae bacterium]|nr:hypothetical protein [Pyrinomonadaceae bacterium]
MYDKLQFVVDAGKLQLRRYRNICPVTATNQNDKLKLFVRLAREAWR